MSLSTIQVLIIDDSAEDRTTWKKFLSADSSTAYIFFEAETAHEGLEVLGREKPDCVLLDNNLPDEDGLVLLPRLLSAPGFEHLPVIMLSGVGNESVAVSAMKNGAQDYVVKGSVTASALQKAVKYSIERVNLQLEVAFQKDVLLESEAKFKGAFENSPIGIGLLNPDRTWHDLNSAFCRILGYTREEILKIPFRKLSTIGDQAISHQSFEDLANGTAAEISSEKNYVHQDGHLVPVGVRGSAIRDSRGRVRYLMMQVLDMTERKRAELNLKETTLKFQTLIESSPAAIVATDEALRVTLWNPASEQIFGWTENEAVGKPLPMVAKTFAGGKDGLSKKIYDSQRPIFVEGSHARKDGSNIHIHSGIMPLRNDGGSVTGLMAVITDVTERARAEAALQSAREQAEAASKAKSEFLANMSHEIRTPISGVLGMTGLMLDSNLDAEQREFVESIRRSADSLLYVINNVLDFSKVEAGKIELETIDFDLELLVRDIARSVEFSAKEKGLSFIVEFPKIPILSMKGDSGRLRQILSNLVSNAIKFTLQGQVRLRVCEMVSGESSVGYRFEVIDSGVGIPEAALGRMFKAFSQADASTTRRFGGTGLGLSISKRLVEMMGGRIGVTSSERDGSTFWFELEFPKGAAQLQDIRQSDPYSPTFMALGARILVAEDHFINQVVIVRLLEKLGCRADAVSTGSGALDMLRSAHYDAVFMDCQMPDLDGYETTRLIRESETMPFRDIPIIAMTANAIKGDRERCLAAGMSDYLSKPATLLQITQVLAKWLPKSLVSGDVPRGFRSVAAAVGSRILEDLKTIDAESGQGLLKQLIDLFLSTTPVRISELRTALESENFAKIRNESHAMKSGAGNLGALHFSELCQSIEDSDDKSLSKRASVLIDDLTTEFERVRTELLVFGAGLDEPLI